MNKVAICQSRYYQTVLYYPLQWAGSRQASTLANIPFHQHAGLMQSNVLSSVLPDRHTCLPVATIGGGYKKPANRSFLM
jgi:hypothetical protein